MASAVSKWRAAAWIGLAMANSRDISYLEQRRREALDRAEAATDPRVVAVHRNFAVCYAQAIAGDARGSDRQFSCNDLSIRKAIETSRLLIAASHRLLRER